LTPWSGRGALHAPWGTSNHCFCHRVYAVQTPMIVKYMMWHSWLHSFYGALSSNPSLFNSNTYWMEQDKLPADRRSW